KGGWGEENKQRRRKGGEEGGDATRGGVRRQNPRNHKNPPRGPPPMHCSPCRNYRSTLFAQHFPRNARHSGQKQQDEVCDGGFQNKHSRKVEPDAVWIRMTEDES